MTDPTPHSPARTDDEPARLDVSLLLRYGLTDSAPGLPSAHHSLR
ncbi:hypothetical protein [Streptomyces qinglanensis]